MFITELVEVACKLSSTTLLCEGGLNAIVCYLVV